MYWVLYFTLGPIKTMHWPLWRIDTIIGINFVRHRNFNALKIPCFNDFFKSCIRNDSNPQRDSVMKYTREMSAGQVSESSDGNAVVSPTSDSVTIYKSEKMSMPSPNKTLVYNITSNTSTHHQCHLQGLQAIMFPMKSVYQRQYH